MMIAPYYYKQRAKEALKGNWQTALLVTFFSSVLLTALSVMENIYFPDVAAYLSYGMVNELYAKLLAIPAATWVWFYALAAVAFAVTPALVVGSNHYFVCRLHGTELGFVGLFSRMRYFWRALWLYAQMVVRIFLWGLLLVVPGVIAAIRYSMAPYYLAQDPDMSAGEAIQKSKAVMEGNKMSYLALSVSFLGWLVLSMAAEMLLASVSVIVALVVSQFLQLMISTYMNCALAAFYDTLTAEGGVRKAMDDMRARMREMGVDQGAMNGSQGDDDELDDDASSDADDSGDTDDSAPDDGADDAAANDDGGEEK